MIDKDFEQFVTKLADEYGDRLYVDFILDEMRKKQQPLVGNKKRVKKDGYFASSPANFNIDKTKI